MAVTLAPDPEFYLDAAKASLIAGLPGRIAAINTERAGDARPFELAVPDASNYLIGGWTITDYPTIELASPDLALRDFSIGQAVCDFDFRVIIRAIDHDANQEDPERLYRRVMRYSRAITETMIEPRAFGERTEVDKDRGVTSAFRFNPEVPERPEIVAFCVLVFWINATVKRSA